MYERLAQIALQEFGDIITDFDLIGRRTGVPLKLRLHVHDGTYIDIWLSPDQKRYAYHWEQRAVRGLLHRHDNAPDHPEVATFPKHFHNGDEDTLEESYISNDPTAAVREFLSFVREQLA
ncbi:hypothetical protein GC175_33345 [bacterium]|nr:hypothetical protein [bacterium]